MKILLIGGFGQLGSEICELAQGCGHTVHTPQHIECDVSDYEQVRSAVKATHPDVLINCAAYHVTKECEKNPTEAFRINATGAANCAEAAEDENAACAYVSTDYVYGRRNTAVYTEADHPCPFSVYGASKMMGEEMTRMHNSRPYIFRVAAVFGPYTCRAKGQNFAQMVLKKLASDKTVTMNARWRISPTYAPDAAKFLLTALEQCAPSTYHAVNSGFCSWFDFAQLVKQYTGAEGEVLPDITVRKREPLSTALVNTVAAERYQLSLRPWSNALKEYCTTHLI